MEEASGYLSVADIANPGLFVCGSRTWISLEIARLYEEHCQQVRMAGLPEKRIKNSPDITTVSNTQYNRTSWTTQHALPSNHLPIITTIKIRHDYRLQQNRRTFTNYKKADWTKFTEDFRSDHNTHQYTHCQQNFHKHHTDGRQAQHSKGQDA